jgi:hypothetical protein
MKPKTERGDRGDRIDVLTNSGDGRRWPDFEGQPPAGLCGSALQQAARAATSARRRRAVAARAARKGVGARAALARPPLLWGMRAAAALPRRRRDAGPDGPRAGLWRRSGLGRASGSAQSGRVDFLFFPKYFSVQKQIQEMPRKCLEPRKIPRKFRKFQVNSQS